MLCHIFFTMLSGGSSRDLHLINHCSQWRCTIADVNCINGQDIFSFELILVFLSCVHKGGREIAYFFVPFFVPFVPLMFPFSLLAC